MVKDTDSYSMNTTAKELPVMFCDMRGFTKMSETMESTHLLGLLNSVFSRLADLIRSNRGTIDKYMGDCAMVFWGAPIDTPAHASLPVSTALEMVDAVQDLAFKAYRIQAWDHWELQLINLQSLNAKKYLYRLYAERVASKWSPPFDPQWDGATNFQTK